MSNPSSSPAIHPDRLFFLSCISLIATSVAFAVVGGVADMFKGEFLLTNSQTGTILGRQLTGFVLGIVLLGPFCDLIGMKRILTLAFLSHLGGVLLMMFASGYDMLWVGAFLIGVGSGSVEAACNPLVATLYPNRKTIKLNQFHVWFPGGIAIGAVASFFLSKAGVGWRPQLILILIPTLIYGFLLIKEAFPATERVQSGLSFVGMVEGAFARPLFWVLLICMGITASLELGPNRWVPAVFAAVDIPGILVLAYTSTIMAVLRYFAGTIVGNIAPTIVLVVSAVLAGLGLTWLSFTNDVVTVFIAATVFAVGVCYFWPTMLGVTSELVPKSGALGLALLGGMGMFASGEIASPFMGRVADSHMNEKLDYATTVEAWEQVIVAYPVAAAEETPERQDEISGAVDQAREVLAQARADEALPEGDTAAALRAVTTNFPAGEQELRDRIANDILGPADNYGGRISFRRVAPFAIVLVLVFGILHFMMQAKGGYKAEKLTTDSPEEKPTA